MFKSTLEYMEFTAEQYNSMDVIPHFPKGTNNSFQFLRPIQVSIYKHPNLLAPIPLNPFSPANSK